MQTDGTGTPETLRRVRSPGAETRERRVAPAAIRRTAPAAARAGLARVGLGDGRAARRRRRDRSRDRALERAVTPVAMVPGPSDADAGRRGEVPRRPDRAAFGLDPPGRDPRRRRALRAVAPPDHGPRAVRRGRLPRHDPRGPAAGAGGRDGPVEQRDHGLPVPAGGGARGDAVRRGDGAGLVRPATAARPGRRLRAHGARRAGAAPAGSGLPDRRGLLAVARVDHGGVRVRVLRPRGRLPRDVRARWQGRAPGSRRRAGRGDRRGRPRPARLHGDRDRTVRPRRLGRFEPAPDARGRARRAPVRQDLRHEPPARGPLVQGRAHDPVRAARGRGPAGFGATARALRGLRVAPAPRRGDRRRDHLRHRRAHPGPRVHARDRVLLERDDARRRRGRRRDHRRGDGARAAALGLGARPPRPETSEHARARGPPAARRRVRPPGPPDAVAAGRRPREHDADDGAADRPRPRLRARDHVLLARRRRRGVRRRPRARDPDAGEREAQGGRPPDPRTLPRARARSPTRVDPGVERSARRAHGGRGRRRARARRRWSGRRSRSAWTDAHGRAGRVGARPPDSRTLHRPSNGRRRC